MLTPSFGGPWGSSIARAGTGGGPGWRMEGPREASRGLQSWLLMDSGLPPPELRLSGTELLLGPQASQAFRNEGQALTKPQQGRDALAPGPPGMKPDPPGFLRLSVPVESPSAIGALRCHGVGRWVVGRSLA